MAVPKIQYREGTTALHRLHPLSKLFVLIVVCLSVFMFEQWYVPIGLTALLFVLYLPRDIGVRRLAVLLRSAQFFILLIVLANIFLGVSGRSYIERAAHGLLQSVRVVDVLAATSLYLVVTDPVDLSDSVIRAALPLRNLGVRTGELSLMVMVIFSFIPHLFDEAKRLKTAQSVRSGHQGRVLGFIGNVVPLLAPLIIGVFRRAEEMEFALTARAFSFDTARTSMHRTRMGFVDISLCVSVAAIFLAGVYAKL